jgi:hypothetical protein
MSEPPPVAGRRSRAGGSASRRNPVGDGISTPSNGGSTPAALVLTLIRGYPPVLGAMLLVDGVLTVILGGDATVSLGEVVAYLLLPPLAMFLLTQLTGGRRPNAVTLGAGAAGAAVLFAALFLGGGVHLVTLPGWALAVVGLLLLGVAVLLMRRSAPVRPVPTVSPLSTQPERDEFTQRDDRADPDGYEFGAASREGYGEHGAHAADYGGEYGGRAADYGTRGDFGRSAEPEWPPARRDEEPVRANDDTVVGLPRVPPGHASGPPEPEWPPRRDPITPPTWDDRDDARSGATPAWSDGPADREWPPGPAANEWPPRRDPEPGSDDAQRSWFEADEPQPADQEWPPSDRTYPSGGRRSRHEQ